MIAPDHLVPRRPTALLLTAALHRQPPVARRALDAWRREVDLERLDATSLRVVGLLADRLDALGAADGLVSHVGTVARFSWLRSHALLAAARPVLEDLAAGDVPFLLLKGAAITGASGRGLGRRPFDDIDILVPPIDVPGVVRVLRARGFESRLADGLLDRPRRYLDAIHSTGFAAGAAEIDLHWRAAPLARHPDVERARWDGPRLVDVGGVQLGVPCATEMLLLALEHDAVPVPSGAGRWVGDAAALMATGEVDPDRLRQRAADLGLAAVVDQAARTYRELTGDALPVAPRRRPAVRGPDRAASSPAVHEVAEAWQRARAAAGPRRRARPRAALRTWQAVGGMHLLRTPRVVPAVAPVDPPPEVRDPWPWACRPVDLGFGLGDPGAGYLGRGWSAPETGFTWTDGPRASLTVPAEVAPGEPLVLDLVSVGLVTPAAPPYTVAWWLDGTPIGVQRIDNDAQTWTTFDVPAGVARGGAVRLDLDVRWPRTPVDAGVGTDLRRLGVGLAWLRVVSGWSGPPPRPAP